MLKSAQQCKDPFGRHLYTKKVRTDPLSSYTQFPISSILSNLPTFLLSLSSHLTLCVNQGPAKQYSRSLSQTAGLQRALAPP